MNVWLGLTGLVTLLALAQGAYAAEPRSLGGTGQSKVSSRPQSISIKERTDNEVENKKRRKKSEREKREERGGGLSRSDFETAAIEKDLGSALDNEIRYMEPLINKLSKKTEQRPKIMRRLIENLHQKALLTFFNETRTYDAAWEKWDKGGRRGLEPKFTMNVSKMWTSKVIQRCQQFITEYPTRRDLDEVTFQLAYAFDQLGRNKEAAQYYSRLVQKFPNSKRVADAHYALGEYYFGKLDFRKALTSFNEVVRFTRAPIRPWAEFKIAWSLYNLQDFRRSLQKWKLVVSLSNSSSSLGKNIKIRLKDEAIRDMLLSFVELKQVNEAMRYLAKNASPDRLGDMFNRLSNLLQDKGEYDQSVRVLKQYISMKPRDLKAADLQVQIVDTANLKADKRLLWTEIVYLNKNYGPSSAWAKIHRNDKQFNEIQEKIHNVSYTYAKKMHYEAQRTRNRYYLAQAITGYKIYLATFPKRKEAGEVSFLLGELQYLRDQYRDAAKTFSAFTSNKQLRKADPAKYEKAFEYQRTSAYFIVQKDLAVLRNQPFNPKQSKRSLSADLQGYINVCDSYMSVFPRKPGSLDCQLDISEIYLKTNNTEQAEKRLATLAKQRSGSKEGKTAAEFLLLLAKDDKKKLAATTSALLAIPQFRTGDLGKRLNEIKRAGRFDELKSLETSGKYEQAAQEFERLGSDRGYSKADTAWFNAGVNYRKANRLDKSVQSFQRIVTDFPKSQLVEGALLEIIDISAGRLQLQVAVNYVDMFIARFPKSPKAPKLLAGACTYYDALSQTERAKQACMRVIARGGSAAEVAAESLAGLYERSGRHSEFISFAQSTLMRYTKAPSAQIELWHRIKESAEKSGNKGKAAQAQKQILAIYGRNKKSVTGPALSYVASFAFANEFAQVEKFRREVLTGGKNGADFQNNIMKRNAALQALTERFTAVAQGIGDAEWSVASLYVIGFAHELVASELLNPPQPPGITGDGWQKVKDSLAGLGTQFQNKAKGYFVSAGTIVSKFNIYSEYGQKVLNSLARLEPSKFKRADDYVPSVLFVGTQIEDSSKVKNALEPRG